MISHFSAKQLKRLRAWHLARRKKAIDIIARALMLVLLLQLGRIHAYHIGHPSLCPTTRAIGALKSPRGATESCLQNLASSPENPAGFRIHWSGRPFSSTPLRTVVIGYPLFPGDIDWPFPADTGLAGCRAGGVVRPSPPCHERARGRRKKNTSQRHANCSRRVGQLALPHTLAP